MRYESLSSRIVSTANGDGQKKCNFHTETCRVLVVLTHDHLPCRAIPDSQKTQDVCVLPQQIARRKQPRRWILGQQNFLKTIRDSFPSLVSEGTLPFRLHEIYTHGCA